MSLRIGTRLRGFALAGTLVTGCTFAPRAAGGGDGGPGSNIDAPDAPAGTPCAGSGAFQLCANPTMDTLTLMGDLDTDSDPRCNTTSIGGGFTTAGQPPACVVIARTIQVDALTAHGTGHVLVLFATGAMTITGALDASSRATGDRLGPGTGTLTCPAFAAAPKGNQAGGAGGSFMTVGGNGGAHDGDMPGTAAPIAAAPSVLRPGCAGQGAGGGAGGAGGGAVYLASVGAITLMANASVDASGRSGDAVGPDNGGPGGGTGGMIVAIASAISGGTNAQMFANGAGGVAGANTQSGDAVGQEPLFANAPAPGGIGLGMAMGGNGFAHAAVDLAATSGMAGGGPQGGGGGGGGAGIIYATPAPTNVAISPAITPM